MYKFAVDKYIFWNSCPPIL